MHMEYISFGLCLTLWFCLILLSMVVMKLDMGEKEND